MKGRQIWVSCGVGVRLPGGRQGSRWRYRPLLGRGRSRPSCGRAAGRSGRRRAGLRCPLRGPGASPTNITARLRIAVGEHQLLRASRAARSPRTLPAWRAGHRGSWRFRAALTRRHGGASSTAQAAAGLEPPAGAALDVEVGRQPAAPADGARGPAVAQCREWRSDPPVFPSTASTPASTIEGEDRTQFGRVGISWRGGHHVSCISSVTRMAGRAIAAIRQTWRKLDSAGEL